MTDDHTCCIPIVIPAYEPDERMPVLLEELVEKDMSPIIVVNDGSGQSYAEVFEESARIMGIHAGSSSTILSHGQNLGKGAALKTALRYALEELPDALGVVTADSDGQHSADSIQRVRTELRNNPDALVLGSRTFDGDNIPWKSRMGNRITSQVFSKLAGVKVSDTQTGLRGIPRAFIPDCLALSGDRFEFEMQMLSAAGGSLPVVEVPIETIYDSRDHHQTHFNTVRDSARIYKALLREPMLFALSSLTSCAIDFGAFAALCPLLKSHTAAYVAIATVLARLISGTYNYTINSRLVFGSERKASESAPRYVMLAGVLMLLSALFTTVGSRLFPSIPEVGVKAVVDGSLFVLSFFVQKRVVF